MQVHHDEGVANRIDPIPSSLRAAFSGSAYSRSVAYFIC